MTSVKDVRRCSNRLILWFSLFLLHIPFVHAIIAGRNSTRISGQVQILEFISSGNGAFKCTGTLIGPTWVLTAAHCINPQYQYAVQAGDLRFGQGELYFVGASFEAPNGNDASLLQLEGAGVPATVMVPLRYGKGRPDLDPENPIRPVVTLRGWGAIGGGSSPATLQLGTLTLQDPAPNGYFLASVGGPAAGVPASGDSGAAWVIFGADCGVHSAKYEDTLNTFDAVPTNSIASWIVQISGIGPIPARQDGTQACELPKNKKTAEVYSSGGVIPVAGYSTTRALFTSPDPIPLYQVTRQRDGAATDILATVTSGYADAADQDSFCANTTCIITKIYDQSPFGNDLIVEGPGGARPYPDSAAVANALPITLNGNKVYGLSITPGVGYRNNNTIGVARNVGPPPVNKTPEGMYMVTSGRNFNNACCFDFGNAETNTRDNGNGHMDALNFGTFCGFPPCSGSGPWVQADLENGQYMGGGPNPSNPANISLPYNFVTAMLKNDSQTTFALKGGNAQSGGLTNLYSGSLPTQKAGYTPMQLEGAVVLGTGGDNSAGGVGSFFEGVMVSGYPSDATEAAVQANIASAGYSGNSFPTNGEAPSYTGPSDPNGPGPQDGFEMPSNEQPNDLMGSKPGMTFYNNRIYAAFQADDASHKLFVTSTTFGQPYPSAVNDSGIHIGSAPAMAPYRHQLYIAFQADDASHQLFITSSPSGSGFPSATPYPNILMGGAPAMVEFRHQLVIAFQANDAGHTLHVTASLDGKSFPAATQVPNVQIGSDPAMAVFRSKLYVAFRANDPSNNVWIASSADGVHFTSQLIPGLHMGPSSSPALVVSNNVLYYIDGANDLANEMLVLSSTDGSTWQGPKAYLNDKMGDAGPGATAIPRGLTIGFQSNDSRNVLFTSFKQTEPLTYGGPNNTGGPQDGFLSPANLQANELMGSRPAFAYSLNNTISTAFQANDASHKLFFASTTFGQSYPPATGYPNVRIGSAPALAYAALGNNSSASFYLAFQADDATNNLFVTSSPDGTNWPAGHLVPNVHMGGAPSLSYFNNKLYMAFQADDSSHYLFVTSSSNGTDWPPATRITNVQMGSDPSTAVLNGRLYVAFRADDPSDNAWIASSPDGVNFTSELLPGQLGGDSAPALVSSAGVLYYICEANDLGHEMLVYASSDGSHWLGPEVYPSIQMGTSGPGASTYLVKNGSDFDFGITLGFQSNDPRNVLFTTIKPTGTE